MSGLDVLRMAELPTANDDRSGRPSTATTPSKVEEVRAAVNQDRRRTILVRRAAQNIHAQYTIIIIIIIIINT